MIRPLYANAAAHSISRGPKGHAGLWFDKFLDKWPIDQTWKLSSELKLNWITEAANSAVGNPNEINECALRLLRLVEHRGGRYSFFENSSRFVTGLGRSHPVENGFTWHPTLGTPYLPGSSVKGLMLAWVKSEVGTSLKESERKRLFGSPAHAGCVCFLDALPIDQVRLEPDVMTPHYAGWHENDPPGDWMSPTPIPFLTVEEGNSFLFAIAPGRDASDGDLDSVMDWLAEALDWAGGGAKTAVGYGRFSLDEQNTKRWAGHLKAEFRQQDMVESPAGRWRLELEGKSEQEVLERVRIRFTGEPLSDPAELRAFAEEVLDLYPDWVDSWRRGSPKDKRTRVGSKKLKQRAHLLDAAVVKDPSDDGP